MPCVEFENINTKKYGVEIYFWKIEENVSELSEIIADDGKTLCDAISRFGSTKRQQEWLATRALLLHTPYRHCKIKYHESGKPYLDNKCISISHCSNYVAIAVSEFNIGIDIETATRQVSKKLAYTLFKSSEYDLVNSSDEIKDLLCLWTVKEAVYKLNLDKISTLNDIHILSKRNVDNHIEYKIKNSKIIPLICYSYINEELIVSFSVL